jgi:hypothetical protein
MAIQASGTFCRAPRGAAQPTLAHALFLRVLKNSLVTRFIGPFSYENLSGQGIFSTPSLFFPNCREALFVV